MVSNLQSIVIQRDQQARGRAGRPRESARGRGRLISIVERISSSICVIGFGVRRQRAMARLGLAITMKKTQLRFTFARQTADRERAKAKS